MFFFCAIQRTRKKKPYGPSWVGHCLVAPLYFTFILSLLSSLLFEKALHLREPQLRTKYEGERGGSNDDDMNKYSAVKGNCSNNVTVRTSHDLVLCPHLRRRPLITHLPHLSHDPSPSSSSSPITPINLVIHHPHLSHHPSPSSISSPLTLIFVITHHLHLPHHSSPSFSSSPPSFSSPITHHLHLPHHPRASWTR